MRRLLLIDDDVHLGPPLAAYFARFDFELQHAVRPSIGLQRLREERFDAAILDVMMPEMDGFELCRTIRRDSDIPILMLTARGEVTDRIVGLELGADDYLAKPFEPRELLARVQTILRRRTPPGPGRSLRFDGLEIDLDRRAVTRDGEPVELTGTEFELLVLLAREPNKVFDRDTILEKLRGWSGDPQSLRDSPPGGQPAGFGRPGARRRAEDIHTRAIDILVSRLRRKLAPFDGIRTLRNAGYLFAGSRR